jgi:hypothetical protein
MDSKTPIEGFYTAFVTGTHSQGIGLFVFREGSAAGVDMGGCTYSGTYLKADDNRSLNMSVTVKQPGGMTTVQGETVPPEGREFEIRFSVPLDPTLPFFRVDTLHGPVNVRLQKIRGF